MRLRLGAVLASLVLLVAWGSMTTSSQSQKQSSTLVEGPCASNGIGLVVDFGIDAKQSRQVCVLNFVGTGWQVLSTAGFRIEGTAEYPNTFMCRIDNVPSADHENCMHTPNPNTGYWKYFYATAASENKWIYSPAGAATRKPQCGDIEGWVYTNSSASKIQQPRTVPKPIKCAN